MVANLQTTFSDAFFLNEDVWILIEVSLKFVPKGPINTISALFQISSQAMMFT